MSENCSFSGSGRVGDGTDYSYIEEKYGADARVQVLGSFFFSQKEKCYNVVHRLLDSAFAVRTPRGFDRCRPLIEIEMDLRTETYWVYVVHFPETEYNAYYLKETRRLFMMYAGVHK